MLTAIIAFIAQIPGLASLASNWMTARYNAQVQITTARIGGDVEAAKAIVAAQVATEQARVAGLSVIAGSTLLTVLVVAFASPLVIFVWKVVVYDTVLGLGSTPPLHGQVAEWSSTIIWSIFGSTAAVGGISAAANLVRGK